MQQQSSYISIAKFYILDTILIFSHKSYIFPYPLDQNSQSSSNSSTYCPVPQLYFEYGLDYSFLFEFIFVSNNDYLTSITMECSLQIQCWLWYIFNNEIEAFLQSKNSNTITF